MRNRSNRIRSRAIVVLLVVSAMFVGAPAMSAAQTLNPTDKQYDQNFVVGGGPDDSVGELPFTGLDVAAIAAIGIGLAGGGFILRRAARAGHTS